MATLPAMSFAFQDNMDAAKALLDIVSRAAGNDSDRSITPESEKDSDKSSEPGTHTPELVSLTEEVAPPVINISTSNSTQFKTLVDVINETAKTCPTPVNTVSTLTSPKITREGRVKRPMNAFMVWSQQRRQQISATGQKFHNSDISKMLGAEWRKMDERDKIPFVDRAKQLREDHFREHPDYVYRPRRKKKAVSKSSGSVDSPPEEPANRSSPVTPEQYQMMAQFLLFQYMTKQNQINGDPTANFVTQTEQNLM